MPRIRSLKPEFWSSPGNKGTDPWARLLYAAMWNWADDHGRGTANARELHSFAFPLEDDPLPPPASELPRLLKEVQCKYSVVFYEVAGRRYYAIQSWEHHNRHERRAKSKYPGPEDGTPYDPYPPDQQEQPQPPDPHGTSDATQGTSLRAQGASVLGVGEQGNRGTGETNSPGGAVVLTLPMADAASGSEPSDAQPPEHRMSYPDIYERAWIAYGKKGAKKTAYAEWQRAVKRAPVDVILRAIAPYVDATPDPKYRKDFERWLKGDCWESAVVSHRRPAVNGYTPYRDPDDESAYDEDL